MKINHRTSDEFRRQCANRFLFSYDEKNMVYKGDAETLFESLIDALEAAEKEIQSLKENIDKYAWRP